MILLNFAHPLTLAHREQIEALTGEPVDDVFEIKTHFDNDQPFAPQLAALHAQCACAHLRFDRG